MPDPKPDRSPTGWDRRACSYDDEMEVADFCSTSRVVIVAGKGGVGKTTVTAALAVTAARAGRSVLIVEVEGKSGLPAMFDAPALGYDEIDLDPKVRARFLTPDAALIDYLVTHGMKRISKRLASSGALDVVATAVPGMKDILVLGKVKSIEESRTADLVIVDAPAAGHAVTFLLSARGLLDAVRVGPIRKQAQDVVSLISDPARCQVMLVTLAEETPVSEVVDTAFAIEDRAGVALGPVIVNGCFTPLPVAVSPDAAAILDDARVADRFVSPREADDLAHAAAFLEERHALQQQQIARLRERLPLPQIQLPFVFDPDITRSELDVLSDAFRLGIEEL
jgi:anion-transporting  ArsA/GET3 family ATPase